MSSTDYGIVSDKVALMISEIAASDKDLVFYPREKHRASHLNYKHSMVGEILFLCIRDKVEIYPNGMSPLMRSYSFSDPELKEKILYEISRIKAKKC